MRLIDADALFQGAMKRQYFDIQAQETARGGGECSMAYSCAMERVREAPTVEAIPVEWLRRIADDDLIVPPYRFYAQAFINMWAQEKEGERG